MFGIQLKLLAVLTVILILQEPCTFQSYGASDATLRDVDATRGTRWKRRSSEGDGSDRWKSHLPGPRNLSDAGESSRSASATRAQRRPHFTSAPLLPGVLLLSPFPSFQRHHSSTLPLSLPWSLPSSPPPPPVARGGHASTSGPSGLLLVEVEQTSSPFAWRASAVTSATPPFCQRSSDVSLLPPPPPSSSLGSFVAPGTSSAAEDAPGEVPAKPIYRTLEPESFYYVTTPPATTPPASPGPASQREGRRVVGANGPVVLTSSQRVLDEARGRVTLEELRASHSSPDASIPDPKTRSRMLPPLADEQGRRASERRRTLDVHQGRAPRSQPASVENSTGSTFQNLSSASSSSSPSPSSSSSSSFLFPSGVAVPKTAVVPPFSVSQGVVLPQRVQGLTRAIRSRVRGAVSLIAPSSPIPRGHHVGSVTQTHSKVLGAFEGASYMPVPVAKDAEAREGERRIPQHPKSRWFPYREERLEKDRELYVKLAERGGRLGEPLRGASPPRRSAAEEEATELRTRGVHAGTSDHLDARPEVPCRASATVGLKTDATKGQPITIVLTSSHLAFPEPQTRGVPRRLTGFPKDDERNTNASSSSPRRNSTSEIPFTAPPLDVPEPSTNFPALSHVTTSSCTVATRVSARRHEKRTIPQIWSSASPAWFPEPQTLVKRPVEEAACGGDPVESLVLESSLRTSPDVTFWSHEMITPMTTV